MPRPLLDVRPVDLPLRLPAALDGTGPAVRVLADNLSDQAHHQVPEQVAVVIRTSGSTGVSRDVMLTAEALHASAEASATHLGGSGQWVLALPTDHVAGLQVLIRSHRAGTRPVPLAAGPFRADTFVQATGRLDDGPAFCSLVPTQLMRLLDDPDGTAALRRFSAVLVGGAALSDTLHQRAVAAGAQVIMTYGATETCGGAVYDGVPLPGVRIEVRDGRVRLAGPMLAHGYLAQPEHDAETFIEVDHTRWFCSSDLGRFTPDGRLEVLGRSDDMVVTGGTNVAPAAVEQVLTEIRDIREICVVGVPDPVWGQRVTALVVAAPDWAPDLVHLRDLVAARLGAAAAPHALILVDQIPARGPGKPDRAAATTLAADQLRTGGDRVFYRPATRMQPTAANTMKEAGGGQRA